ncbi:MAG: DUF1538 domain-containing protein [Clostridiales bacterium]|nr:DUF1538 domain-containing protein [Clostridiales bacterium]
MGYILLSKLKEALFSVLPVGVIVFILSLTPLVDVTLTETLVFGVCVLMLVVGIALFNLGAELSMTPMGEQVGSGLTRTKKVSVLLSICFIMGVLITVAEPDLTVLASQVAGVIDGTVLTAVIGVGVGVLLLVAVLKIVFHKSLSMLLLFFYLALFSTCAILFENGKEAFLPLAFDSGGVTTGPITVPFIMALGVGIAGVVGGKNSNENSFGLVALCSIGPIIAVVFLALFSNGTPSYNTPDYSISTAIGENLPKTVLSVFGEVFISLALIVLFFIILQIFVLKLPKKKLKQMTIGIICTYFGLVIFLLAVNVGFMPIGNKLGTALAKESPVLLVVFGVLIGCVVVLAEPAVHVLTKQVERVTGGSVSKKAMLIALSIGVGISIGLSIIRMIFGFSILYYIVPGYLLSLGLSFFVPKIYTAIAFDSGGVASGPLTSSFILPLVIGACMSLCGESQVLSLAFGVVAMVAMTPLITIQSLGFRAIIKAKMKERAVMKRIITDDDEQIIDFS